jgi:hypothetical protein
MKLTRFALLFLSVTAFGAILAAVSGAPSGTTSSKDAAVTVINGRDLLQARGSGTNPAQHNSRLSLTSAAAPARVSALGGQDFGQGRLVPLWTFQVNGAGRDGLNHTGAMVGTNPFTSKQTSRIPVLIIPMIVTTHTVAVSFDPTTGLFGTAPGDVTLNSNAPDNNCLSAPNNVPSRLVRQSPIFEPASFTFGGIYLGYTQYIDAFQRANFYGALGNDPDNYHVLFDPVRVTSPVVIDVPANEGLAITNGQLLGPPAFCAPVQILDINWFDSYIAGTLLPQLASQGVNPGSVPLFFLYNTNLASPVNNLFTCCILGYHSYAGEPTPSQLYSVAEIDVSGFFPPGFENTSVLAHEMGELVNDPYIDNQVPPWGHTGQQGACQENLEVGDPLTGTVMPQVTMPNGYTYNVQELVFFSWFFGGRSIGVNGWYSSNGTFMTDAGPNCGAE